jgi:hypothetical protein
MIVTNARQEGEEMISILCTIHPKMYQVLLQQSATCTLNVHNALMERKPKEKV